MEGQVPSTETQTNFAIHFAMEQQALSPTVLHGSGRVCIRQETRLYHRKAGNCPFPEDCLHSN